MRLSTLFGAAALVGLVATSAPAMAQAPAPMKHHMMQKRMVHQRMMMHHQRMMNHHRMKMMHHRMMHRKMM